MNERRGTRVVDGKLVLGTIVESTSGLDETFFPEIEVKVSNGASNESEPIELNLSDVSIKSKGKTERGLQEIVLNIRKNS